jgi:hypothetical protein
MRSNLVVTSVLDQYLMNPDPDPAFYVNPDPDPGLLKPFETFFSEKKF